MDEVTAVNQLITESAADDIRESTQNILAKSSASILPKLEESLEEAQTEQFKVSNMLSKLAMAKQQLQPGTYLNAAFPPKEPALNSSGSRPLFMNLNKVMQEGIRNIINKSTE